MSSVADRSDAEANQARQKAIVQLLEREDAAFDIGAYRDAPPGLRVWCGATVDTADIGIAQRQACQLTDAQASRIKQNHRQPQNCRP